MPAGDVNPNADSNYIDSVQHRANLSTAARFVGQLGQMKSDQEREQALNAQGLTLADYPALKKKVGVGLTQAEQAAADASDAAEHKIGHLEAAQSFTENAAGMLGAIPAAAELMSGGAAGAGAAIGEGALGNEMVNKTVEFAQQMLPNHPKTATLIGGLAAALLWNAPRALSKVEDSLGEAEEKPKLLDKEDVGDATIEAAKEQGEGGEGVPVTPALPAAAETPTEGANLQFDLPDEHYSAAEQTAIKEAATSALGTAATRHPQLFSQLDDINITHLPPPELDSIGGEPSAAFFPRSGKNEPGALWLDPELFRPNPAASSRDQSADIARVLDHELTHVAQKAIYDRGLSKTFHTAPGYPEGDAYRRGAGPVVAAKEAAPPPLPSPVSNNGGGAEVGAGAHSDQTMLAQAAAQPMSREEMEGIELDGGGEHALPSSPVTALTMLRAHNYVASQAARAIEAAQLYQSTLDPDAKAAFDESVSDLASVSGPRMRAIWHQAGLTLQKAGAPEPASTALRDVMDLLKDPAFVGPAGGGERPRLNGSFIAPGDYDRLARALAGLPTVGERELLAKQAASAPWTLKSSLYNLYVNSILSFNSAGKKAASDVANTLFQIPSRYLAEYGSRGAELVTGADRGTMGVAPGEANALARATFDGLGAALKVGARSAYKGEPVFESDIGFLDNPNTQKSLMAGSGYENTWFGRAIDYYGHIISLPGRSIIGIDQFSKAINYHMELRALAQRAAWQQAAAEGLSGAEQAGRASELGQQLFEQPQSWMTEQAMKTAKVNTFQADLEGSLAKADELRRSSYVWRTLMPFFKTPVNITLQGIRQSPLAALSPTWRSTVAAGGPDAALALSKTALGSAIMGYLTYHVLQNHITGGVPENLDAESRKLWLSDHQPYSVAAGKDENGKTRFISYEGLEPWSWLIGAAADMAPAHAYLERGDSERAAMTLATALMREADRQPMWGALHQLATAVDDAEKDRTGRVAQFAGREAGGVIPATIANYASDEDPIRRQTLGALDEIRDRIPFLRKNGLPTLDPFGKPMIMPPGFVANEFPAYKLARKSGDAVADELIRLHDSVGFEPPQVPKAIGGRGDPGDSSGAPEQVYGATLTKAEQNRWIELRADPGQGGKAGTAKLYDKLSQVMASEQYKKLGDIAQANLVHDLFLAYQKAGEGRLIAGSGELQGRMLAAAMAKKAAYAPRGVASLEAP